MDPRGRADMDINPRVVPLTPQSKALFDAARKDAQKNLVKSQNTPLAGIVARTSEHISKIALTVEDGPVITADSMSFAIDLMVKVSESMASSFRLRVSDSAIEKTKKKVLQVVHSGGKNGVSTSHLTRKTQFLRDKRERDSSYPSLNRRGWYSQRLRRLQVVPSRNGFQNKTPFTFLHFLQIKKFEAKTQ